ncbi:TauD/TfdA family dioxygenase [Xenorhabdus sp. Reich]|uniref:TauD/TfdA family dioxygenase n=1 Tax=Xenorhabdus littoralis TaxID=2582835 RepID=A0ABU4SGN6_9GAMM|nr:TauD/TfdA family dioxygenase [Xenorhabdus sp. Reich]MDX7997730.1 TauD/TfdA family dioxygenase [Xenorhabdus sp. Reich]
MESNNLTLFNEVKNIINTKEYNLSEYNPNVIFHKLKKGNIDKNTKRDINENINNLGYVYIINFDKEDNVNDVAIFLENIFGETINNKNRKHKKYEIIESQKKPKWFFESHYSQPVHTDEGHEKTQPDTLALYCETPSEIGGDSILVSAKSIYNLLVDKYNEKIHTLFNDDCVSFINKQFTKKIFSKINKNIGISFSPLINNFKCTKEVHSILRDLTHLIHQKENQYRFKLKNNQCVVFSNYLYLHSRTAFLENSKRKLYRFWF